MKKEKILLVSLIVLVILVIVGIVMGKAKAAKKAREVKEIEELIAQNIGATGEDIDSLLYKVKPATNYNATHDVTLLMKSDGLLFDDDKSVYSVLSGKTKAQLATINQTMLRLNGKSLNDFLKGLFMDVADRDPLNWSRFPNYEKALNMIKNAA